MEDVLDILHGKYLEEGKRLALEVNLILSPENMTVFSTSVFDEIFRIMHTLKGNSAMFKQKEVEAISKRLEVIYDLIRRNKLAFSSEICELTLQSVDQILNWFDEPNSVNRNIRRNQRNLVSKLSKVHALATSVETSSKKRRANSLSAFSTILESFKSFPVFHVHEDKSRLPLLLKAALIKKDWRK